MITVPGWYFNWKLWSEVAGTVIGVIVIVGYFIWWWFKGSKQ